MVSGAPGIDHLLYLAIPLAFNPQRRGSPGTIFVKFCVEVSGMVRVQNGIQTLPKISTGMDLDITL